MPHPPRRPWPLALARILGSFAALAVLVVGLPLALLWVGTLPSGMPTPGAIGEALTASDDSGQALFTLLTLICWALWAWFMVSLLLEAVALLRHRSAPRVRALAAPQRLAALLLGGMLVLPPATALAATPATAAPAATAVHVPSAPQTPVSAHQQPDAHDGPTHIVGATGETVWDIAEHFLGDGRRHTELRTLNPHLPQTSTLPAGTVVHLPHDARPSADRGHDHAQAGASPQTERTSAADGSESASSQYAVVSGDSLTFIAQKKMGDADRWREIYRANRDEIRDPDLIYPGQHLALPQQVSDPAPAPPQDQGQDRGGHEHDQAPHGKTAHPQQDDDHHQAGPEERDQTPEHDASGGGPAPHVSPSVPQTAQPSARPAPTPSRSTGSADSVPAASAEGVSTATVAAIGGGVLAAALLSTLATRRILQQRRRHRGRRIALPEDGAAATEQNLRAAEAALDTTMLDGALRTAAVHLAEAGRGLPALSAAVISPTEIVLHLTSPAEPVAPFTAIDDAQQCWTCPTRGGDLLPQEQSDDVDAPFPALASLGWDDQGHLILIDLETVSHLHLTGTDRHRVLRTLALELAASEFADCLTVSPTGECAPGLREELPERVSGHADFAAAAHALRAHHAEQQRALSVLEADSLHRARTGVDTAAAWNPHIVLGDLDNADDADTALLQQVLAQHPRSATVLVTAGDEAAAAPVGAWVVHADTAAGPVPLLLPGTQVEGWCRVQALSDEDYAYALEVLATTRSDDVPAPQPIATPPKAVPEPPAPELEETAPVSAPAASVASEPVGPAQVPSLMAQFAAYEDDQEVPEEQQPAAAALEEPAASSSSGGTGGEDAEASRPSPLPDVQPAGQAPESVPADGPVVLVLGPVDIDGPRGTVESKRRRLCTELAAWLVLRPGLDHHALDEAMWPGREPTRNSRNTLVSYLRTWLGSDDEGTLYFPRIATTNDARYALAPTVDSDWHQFQRLTSAAAQSPAPQAAAQLRAALELVRGRPFSSVNRRRYAWAEHQAQDMISAIVDAAADLAEHYLVLGDARGALWAATKGLDAAPEMENLYRVVFRAYAALGDYDELERAAQKLDTLNMELEVDMEEATAALLAQLSKSA
ncbi:LysM peptidoglycan-binding domain-containing protein [Streptomyces angustmyceticus]|uniref:LysM peptidoglycan-binding domain-containing protein n=1 Tax=Streptomyces angustmyceticus TaxID=285578 RepID=UPI003D921C06